MVNFILICFAIFIVAMVAKIIYEVQQNKKQEKEADELCKTEAEFEAKDRFQKLAGIGQPKNELDPEIWKYVADKVSKEGFPEPDPSIPVTTAKLTTIDTKFEDSDPLSNVAMSRVSKEAKQKMAAIAKEDIKDRVEKQASIFPEAVEYTDEYFKTAYSKPKKKSNSKMPKEIKDAMLNAPILKPKKKATKKTTKK